MVHAPNTPMKSNASRRRSLQPSTLVLNSASLAIQGSGTAGNSTNATNTNGSNSSATHNVPVNPDSTRPPLHHFARTGTPASNNTGGNSNVSISSGTVTTASGATPHKHVHHVRTSSLPPRYSSNSTNSLISQNTSQTSGLSAGSQQSTNVAHPRRHSTTSVEGFNTLHGLASLNGVGLIPAPTLQSSGGVAMQNGNQPTNTPTPTNATPTSLPPTPGTPSTIPSSHVSLGADLSIKGYSWSSTPKKLKRRSVTKQTAQKAISNAPTGTPPPIPHQSSFRRPGTPVRQNPNFPESHVERQLHFESETESASVDMALLVGYDDETVETISVISDADDILTIMSLESMESDRSSVDFMLNHGSAHFGRYYASNPPSISGGGGIQFPFYQHSYPSHKLPSSQPSTLHHMRRVSRQVSNTPDRPVPKKAVPSLRSRVGKRKLMSPAAHQQNHKSVSPSKLSIQGKTTKFTPHTSDSNANSSNNNANLINSPPQHHQMRHASPSRPLSASSTDSNDLTPSQFSHSPSASTIHSHIDDRHSAFLSRNLRNDESIEDMSAQLHHDDTQSEGFEHLEDLYKYFGYLPQTCKDEKKDILRKHDSYADLVKPLLSPKNHTFHQLET